VNANFLKKKLYYKNVSKIILEKFGEDAPYPDVCHLACAVKMQNKESFIKE
jgi:hypothetical protein